MSESYPVHDAYGNVCEIRRADAPVVALLWGYNYSRPVAIGGRGVISGSRFRAERECGVSSNLAAVPFENVCFRAFAPPLAG